MFSYLMHGGWWIDGAIDIVAFVFSCRERSICMCAALVDAIII